MKEEFHFIQFNRSLLFHLFEVKHPSKEFAKITTLIIETKLRVTENMPETSFILTRKFN